MLTSSCNSNTSTDGKLMPVGSVFPTSPAESRGSGATASTVPGPVTRNRLRLVREQQALTLRTVSRRCGTAVRQLREEEDPASDLPVSALQRWRIALEVPLVELLIEPGNQLSDVISQRAKLVRVMKTARSVCETARDEPTRRLGTMLCEQLLDLMPELAEQTAWPTVGSRRSHADVGRIAENPLRIDLSELG